MPELTSNLKNVLIAAVLAIAAVALTLIYVSNSKSKQSASSPTYRTVLVAARDIPVGTTGAQLAHSGWLTTARVPADAVANGAVPSKAALAALVAIQPTYHGEQIVARRFGTSQQEGSCVDAPRAAAHLRSCRATRTSCSPGRAPGRNRVDVVGSVKKPEGSQNALRRDRRARPARRQGTVARRRSGTTSVDLQLTSAQAQKLFWMEKNADWSLLLRPSMHAVESGRQPTSAASARGGRECTLTRALRVGVVGAAAAAASRGTARGQSTHSSVAAGRRAAADAADVVVLVHDAGSEPRSAARRVREHGDGAGRLRCRRGRPTSSSAGRSTPASPTCSAADRRPRPRSSRSRRRRGRPVASADSDGARPRRHRLLAEGRVRQVGRLDEPRRGCCRASAASGRCSSTSTSSSATRRSCSASSRAAPCAS